MNAIYRMNIDCGRMGSVEGVFVATESDIKGLIGKEIYFGEILGKHSEISIVMEEKHITKITDDEKVVEVINKHSLTSGYNPFDYFEEEE